MKRVGDLVRARLAEIEQKDRQLAEELGLVRSAGRAQDEARVATSTAVLPDERGLEALVSDGPGQREAEALALETIVLRTGRPVLAIQDGTTVLKFTENESRVWKKRLLDASAALAIAIPAVGRVELAGNPSFEWVGTGWLVDEDIIVTNRHVAREFAHRRGFGFDFLPAIGGGLMRASLDFLEEIDRPNSLAIEVGKVLHIEDDDGPDVAFLQLKSVRGKRLDPIPLATEAAALRTRVAVIGYPARDSRIPEPKLMTRIFGDIYDKKRLAPGEITGRESEHILHDCSTLGGNSGSAVVDLSTGRAVGLHFAGRFLEANFAVAAEVVADRLRAVSGRPAPRWDSRRADSSHRGQFAGDTTSAPTPRASPTHTGIDGDQWARSSVTVTLPVRIRVEVGSPCMPGGPGSSYGALPLVHGGSGPNLPAAAGETDDIDVEAPRDPASYDDRDGYVADFLDAEVDVPLPEPDAIRRRDILTFEKNGTRDHVLTYRHFSVVMSRSRRLCLYSAVNIDGGHTRKKKRTRWHFDPRIPRDQQILQECYGNAPKFSRGHMTRREDPVWGPDDDAGQGNDDSMHATNAVPQMQPFNAGIWLGLEDYALDNARADRMRISVFTGPFFTRSDPLRFGVRIPGSFWKIIAFVHDETGKLSATGYTMSQDAFLAEDEFVFGRHETAQVPIASIERRSGFSFGEISERDPLRDAEESMSRPLTDMAQIRFF